MRLRYRYAEHSDCLPMIQQASSQRRFVSGWGASSYFYFVQRKEEPFPQKMAACYAGKVLIAWALKIPSERYAWAFTAKVFRGRGIASKLQKMIGHKANLFDGIKGEPWS